MCRHLFVRYIKTIIISMTDWNRMDEILLKISKESRLDSHTKIPPFSHAVITFELDH